ncbi:hypothetical protein FSPOR_9914 [Fusarium sporotrichioides]|uniref:DUF7908 domain-containing protein n=1 Tax=Fusarium sporotrichioides TaxID=5514 RepID=A0A395RN81_FUSSP|nr:hypothetical protein FSPOR_9914 [Fusarium sporotrichioides]
MTPKRVVPLLLSCFVTTASSFDKVVDLPETYCVTYLSTYLAPISGINTGLSSSEDSSLSISTVVDDFTSDTQDTQTSSSFPLDDPISTSVRDVSVTTSFPTNTETFTLDPTEIPEPDGRDVVFRVIPSSDDTRRSLHGRALGGYVGSQTDLCDDAVVYNLFQGRLYEGGFPIYYNSESYKELRGEEGPLPRGAVTTTFLDDGGYIEFVSSSLPGGRAGFCQVSSSGQVYLTFGSSPTDCAPVRLAVIGVEECLDEASTSDTLSTRTRVTSDVQDLTEITRTTVETSLEPIFTQSTSIDASLTQDVPQTKSFQTTTLFFNSSTTNMNFPDGPTQSSIPSSVTIDSTSKDPAVLSSSSDPILSTTTDIVSSLTDIASIDSTSTEPAFPPEETSTTGINNEIDTSSSSETDTTTTFTTEAISLTETSTTGDTSTALETGSTTESSVDTTETTIADTATTSGTEATSLTETSTAADTSTALESSSTAELSVDSTTTGTNPADDTTSDTTAVDTTATLETTAADTSAADTTAADTTAADTTAPNAAPTTADATTTLPQTF